MHLLSLMRMLAGTEFPTLFRAELFSLRVTINWIASDRYLIKPGLLKKGEVTGSHNQPAASSRVHLRPLDN